MTSTLIGKQQTIVTPTSTTSPDIMNNNTYKEILKVWNSETPDDFAIFSELYYQMFGEDYDIPYTTSSTCSSFFPFD